MIIKRKIMKMLTAKEEEIMGYFWEKGPLFVKQLLDFYDEPRPHFNTLSTIVRGLEEKGFLRKEYAGHNRKTAHLKICGAAAKIIRDGQAAQKKFLGIMLNGFSEEETENMWHYTDRMRQNINLYLKGAE